MDNHTINEQPPAGRPTAVAFDFGGVLIRWEPRNLYRKLFPGDEAAMERFFVEVDFLGWNVEQDAGRPFAEGVEELSARFPHYREQIAAYPARWRESIVGFIEPTVDILRRLRQAGVPLYGFSNWSAETFASFRREVAFFDWFDEIILSGELKVNKPDERMYAALLKAAGRPAAEVLLVDDSWPNIEAARRLGMPAHHFQGAHLLEAELQAIGLLSPSRPL